MPEIEPADELADDEDVYALAAGRAQVGVDVELRAQAEHALLGAYRGRVEVGMADRGLEHRLGAQARSEGLRRERVARLADRLRPERALLELEVGRERA